MAAITRTDAARFLTQATFGPTKAGIDELIALGSYEKWIDQQFAKPASLTVPYVKANSNGSNGLARHHIWWDNAIRGEDQLRQRLAFAWSQLFVVSDIDYELSNSQYGISNYYDMLATMADGTYRELLEAVTLHPVMGIYLSMLRNEKADPARNVRPDENYAREVLQLFSIGLYEMKLGGTVRRDASGNPVPTYDQETVEEFAKVFTGWNLAGTEWTTTNLPRDAKERPMVPVEEFHDRTAKRLLNGTVLPRGGTARSDMDAALDNIAGHFNVGPFIAQAMIKRLVTSNPSWKYIKRVSIAFNRGRYKGRGSGKRGDLVAVTKAVLLDREARMGHINRKWRFGKFKEPVLRISQLFRAFDAEPGPERGIYRTHSRPFEQIGQVTSQAVMESPSVFNYFKPDHPLGIKTLLAPEKQILTEINIASLNNLLFLEIYRNNSVLVDRDRMSRLFIDDEVAMAGNINQLIDHLDVLLLAGALHPRVKRALASHLAVHPNTEEGRLNRVLDATYCLVGSPVHLVQK